MKALSALFQVIHLSILFLGLGLHKLNVLLLPERMNSQVSSSNCAGWTKKAKSTTLLAHMRCFMLSGTCLESKQEKFLPCVEGWVIKSRADWGAETAAPAL